MKIMKKSVLGAFVLAVVLISAMALSACEGPEGPMGQQGPSGSGIKIVDYTGKEVGIFIAYVISAPSYCLINNGNYTFFINESTGEIRGNIEYIYASGENQAGILYSSSTNYSKYPNYIEKYNFGYFLAKNRNPTGHSQILEDITTASRGDNAGWENRSDTGKRVLIEKLTAATDDSSIIGFIPVLPLRFEW